MNKKIAIIPRNTGNFYKNVLQKDLKTGKKFVIKVNKFQKNEMEEDK